MPEAHNRKPDEVLFIASFGVQSAEPGRDAASLRTVDEGRSTADAVVDADSGRLD
jgi:hypothetical protein